MACDCLPPLSRLSIFVVYCIEIFWPKLVPCLVLALPTIPPWVLFVFSLVIIIFGNTKYHKYCLSRLIWNVELFVITGWTSKSPARVWFDGTGCKLYSLSNYGRHEVLSTSIAEVFTTRTSKRSHVSWRWHSDVAVFQCSGDVTTQDGLFFYLTKRYDSCRRGCRVIGEKCCGCHWLVRTSVHSRVNLKSWTLRVGDIDLERLWCVAPVK